MWHLAPVIVVQGDMVMVLDLFPLVAVDLALLGTTVLLAQLQCPVRLGSMTGTPAVLRRRRTAKRALLGNIAAALDLLLAVLVS